MNIENILYRLSKSKFRSSFHLKEKDINYINEKGINIINSMFQKWIRYIKVF